MNQHLIEHVVVAATQTYEQVLTSLDKRLGSSESQEEVVRLLSTPEITWEQIEQTVQQRRGSSDFTLFAKVDFAPLLARRGAMSRAMQYTIGNPVLAVQMLQSQPEAGLYIPLRLVVYEYQERTFVAYDRLVSLLHQYQQDDLLRVAMLVEQKLEALVAAVTAAPTS